MAAVVTFYDVTAGALDLPVPDFSSVRKFARSAMTFKRYPALPRGAFECKPWPGGSDDEPITAEEKELLRKRLIGLDAQMTPRERRRALDLFLQSPEDMPGYKQRPWPKLP